jgi:hypothetical protein
MLLRTIISAWTIEIAWGMHEIQSLDAKRNMVTFPLKDLIEKVALEDDIEQQRVLFFLKSKKDVLEQMLQDQQLPFAQIYPQLARVYNYEVALKRYALPSILNEIIRKNIIPRVKAFVQEDAYKLKPHQCFSQFVDERRLSAIQTMYLDPSCCQETSEASIIKTEMIRKKRDDQELAKALLQNRLRPDANPVNIIACLNLLSALEPVDMAACENAAIMSILLQTKYRERRFADLDKRSTLKPESLIRKR